MSPGARPVALAVAAVILLAASLRVAVGSLSPVIAQISVDIALPAEAVGLIGAAPPLAFAVFGLLTPALARRFRLETLALAALIIAVVGLGSRAFAPDAGALLSATLVAFAGIGVGNVILPAVIKKYFPSAIGPMTTVYVSAMSIATFAPSSLAVPIADTVGWRFSLGVWAAVGVVAVVPWVVLLLRARRDGGSDDIDTADRAILVRLVRLPLTWALVVAMAATSSTVYVMFGWLPPLIQERAGVDAATAGAMLGVFSGMGLPFALILPFVVSRLRIVRGVFVLAAVPGLFGVAGMLWAPTLAPWLWVVLVSFPTALFPVVLVLIGLRTRTHAATVALSGLVQSSGYAVAAICPIVFGALHSGLHSWDAPLWILAALFAVGIPAGWTIARYRTVEEAWERRFRRPW